jgi:hypothetical protein
MYFPIEKIFILLSTEMKRAIFFIPSVSISEEVFDSIGTIPIPLI